MILLVKCVNLLELLLLHGLVSLHVGPFIIKATLLFRHALVEVALLNHVNTLLSGRLGTQQLVLHLLLGLGNDIGCLFLRLQKILHATVHRVI